MEKNIKFIDKNKKEILRFTQSLVKVNSVNGNETSVAELIKEKLKDYSISSKLVGKNMGRKNLVAEIKGSMKGKTILLNGHTDVVPAGNLRKWKYPPFSGKYVNGKIYGRGANDMKAGLAALSYSAISLIQSDAEFRGKILLVFNSEEEGGSHAGIREVLKTGITADACIVGEPMESGKLAIGYRGIYRFKIITKGQTAHTGNLENKGISAVTKMAKILLALENTKMRYTKHKMFPPPKINPGSVIKGGLAINIVPDECEALVDCRIITGQTKKTIKEDIQKALEKAVKKDHKIDFKIEELAYVPAFATNKQEAIVKILSKNIKETLGKTSLKVSGAVCDGNIIYEKGIPVVCFGPGGERVHSENEFVYTKNIIDVAKISSNSILDFLK